MSDTVIAALGEHVPHPFTQAEKELLQLIKRTNPSTSQGLTEENIIFSKATAVTRPDGRNSKVVVVGIPEKGVAEKPRTIYYWRVDLGILFQRINATVGLPISEGMTTHDLIPALNLKYGTTLTTDDIELTPLDIDPLPGIATIKAVEGNVKYIGEFMVTFDRNDINLDEAIVNDTLDGFNYPNADLTKGQATVYSFSLESAEESIPYWLALEVNQPLPAAAEDHFNALYGLDNAEIWSFQAEPGDYNLTGATVKYVGVNDAAALKTQFGIDTNQLFAKVAIIELGADCANFAGLFLIGWEIVPPAPEV